MLPVHGRISRRHNFIAARFPRDQLLQAKFVTGQLARWAMTKPDLVISTELGLLTKP
jgi:hypothetical protein